MQFVTFTCCTGGSRKLTACSELALVGTTHNRFRQLVHAASMHQTTTVAPIPTLLYILKCVVNCNLYRVLIACVIQLAAIGSAVAAAAAESLLRANTQAAKTGSKLRGNVIVATPYFM